MEDAGEPACGRRLGRRVRRTGAPTASPSAVGRRARPRGTAGTGTRRPAPRARRAPRTRSGSAGSSSLNSSSSSRRWRGGESAKSSAISARASGSGISVSSFGVVTSISVTLSSRRRACVARTLVELAARRRFRQPRRAAWSRVVTRASSPLHAFCRVRRRSDGRVASQVTCRTRASSPLDGTRTALPHSVHEPS